MAFAKSAEVAVAAFRKSGKFYLCEGGLIGEAKVIAEHPRSRQ
jgi:hypothetical protein